MDEKWEQLWSGHASAVLERRCALSDLGASVIRRVLDDCLPRSASAAVPPRSYGRHNVRQLRITLLKRTP